MVDERHLASIREEALRASRELGEAAPSPYMPMTLEDRAWLDGIYDFGGDALGVSVLPDGSNSAEDARLSGRGPGSEEEQLSLF